jgi:predicted aspartyl protease
VQVKQEHILCWLVLAACPALVVAQQAPGWTTEGPFIDADEFSIELPLDVVATKLYVNVDIGGTTRRFVFDTGSPSMINAALAEELGLEVVDKQKGTDAHGVVVESNIVQADLVLDGVTLHKVPIFAADFSASKAAQCLVGDGVLGSEVLPLCAWQIDLPNSVLRCESDVRKLDHVDGASRQALHNFGYPHTPYLDVQFAKKAKSKAMFDTGSPTYMAISPPDFEGAKKAGGIGKTLSGFGSAGGSLGGQAPNATQTRAELKTLAIGKISLGRVDATLRESAPSLIGAMLLDHFLVTLDAKSKIAYFDVYRDGPFKRPSFGFSLGFDDGISVALVWDDSPASEAGLRVGQALTSINGEATDASCDSVRRALNAMSADTIVLQWDGGSAVLAQD